MRVGIKLLCKTHCPSLQGAESSKTGKLKGSQHNSESMNALLHFFMTLRLAISNRCFLYAHKNKKATH